MYSRMYARREPIGASSSAITNLSARRSDTAVDAAGYVGIARLDGPAVGHDFSQIAVSAPSAAGGTALTVQRHQYPLLAAIRAERAPQRARDEARERPTKGKGRTGHAGPGRGSSRLARGDAGRGNESAPVDASALAQQADPSGSLPSVPEPAEGETVTFPDIVIPVDISTTDAVMPGLTYNSTTTVSATEPGAGLFGLTTFSVPNVTGIKVTNAPGVYIVSATVDSPITVQVRNTTGPDGQVDIKGDADPAITGDNYGSVVSDLTPDVSDLKGRPPRNSFWAHDLTLKHENFHATEYAHYGGQGSTLAMGWLAGQTASSAADVQTLLAKVPQRIITTVVANMSPPAVEERAYSDGAPSYKARADAIKAKGDAGKYPHAP